MSGMVLQRPARQLVRVCVSLLVVGAAAMYFFFDYRATGERYPQVFMWLFGVWAAIIALNIVRRSTLAWREGEALVFRGLFSDRRIEARDIARYSIEEGGRVGVLMDTSAGKPRYTAFSQRSYGPENVTALLAELKRMRPDLENVTAESFQGGAAEKERDT